MVQLLDFFSVKEDQNWVFVSDYQCPGDPCNVGGQPPSPITPNPTPSPTSPPTPPPTEGTPVAPGMCCAEGETKMKAFNNCLQYYWCYSGVVNDYLTGPLPGYGFDESIQNWASQGSFDCQVDLCGADAPPSPPPTPSPTTPNAQPTSGPPVKCCNPDDHKMKAINDCTQYYVSAKNGTIQNESRKRTLHSEATSFY